MSRVGGAVQRIEKRTEERVQKAVEQVAGEASATITAKLDAANERAERIIAATAKVEARQLWSAAAAMLLASPRPAGWSASWRRGRAEGCRLGPAGGSRRRTSVGKIGEVGSGLPNLGSLRRARELEHVAEVHPT
ncbi:hypothetical protein GCM10028815_17530 [Mariniluteicoccus flavus]